MKNTKISSLLLSLTIFFTIIMAGCSYKKSSTTNSLPNSNEKSLYLTNLNMIKNKIYSFEENTKGAETLPKDINAMSIELNNILKEILKDPESLHAIEKDIIGESKDLYITFSKPISSNGYTFRFVEFGMLPLLNGNEICLYLQIWDNDKHITLQEPHKFVQTSSATGKYLYYGAIQKDNETYLNIISSMNGVDYNFINLVSYKLKDKNLEKLDISNRLTYSKSWNLEKNDTNAYTIYRKGAIKYTCKADNGSIIIKALGANEKELDTLKIQ